jgi:regulatory protein
MGYNLDVKKMSKEDWSLANCKERAIYIITNYSKTEKQLRDKLKKGGKYTDEIIDETIKFLKKHNFINDDDFAKRFVELHKNTYSIKVLKQKLYQKGIKRNIIDNLFDSEEVEFDEESIIKKLLLKKCPDYYTGLTIRTSWDATYQYHFLVKFNVSNETNEYNRIRMLCRLFALIRSFQNRVQWNRRESESYRIC